jgi:2OG-Fe(II) oxygenase superfamily
MSEADDNDDSTSIESTGDEALCELLGLPSEVVLLIGTAPEEIPCDGTLLSQTENQYCSKNSNNTIHRIPLPRNVSRYCHPPELCTAFTIANVMSVDECQSLIAIAASAPSAAAASAAENGKGRRGFHYITEATHTAPDGARYTVKLQNSNPHKLAVFDHPSTVQHLWRRLEPILRTHCSDFVHREQCGPPIGLNPRLRVLRYDSTDQDHFAPHFDATTRFPDAVSRLTVLLYLNTADAVDFGGGETLFLNAAAPQSEATVVPQAGTIVIFEHDLYHSGVPLDWGTKYVLRTDVLFAADDADNMQTASSVKGNDGKGSHRTDPARRRRGISGATTVRQLTTQLGMSQEECIGLMALGIMDDSIASFCAPGPFALQTMLAEAELSRAACSRLIDAAYVIWEDRR